MLACRCLGIKQIFTSYNNPKGNADTERMIRTLKEELIWSNDFESLETLSTALQDWIHYYNTEYLHSSLNYLPPSVFEKHALSKNIKPPLKVA